jgi:metal-sulfur cluster biosynthetic enzyme|tara:strand:+ start:316 stop:642 length:327 start_codon:yes stop_codon:yes gene_type:complete
MSIEETKNKIIENLKGVQDPEMGCDVYNLGLIYDIKVGESYCDITMSLTSAFCPAADMIVNDVKGAALAVDGIKDCKVEVTFNPPWDPSRLTEEGHAYLNYMYSDHME